MGKKFLSQNGLTRLVNKFLETFSKVEHTHTKSQITDLPLIPTKVSDLVNDSGFTKTVVDSSLSPSSTNPVQNKVVFSAIDEKIGTNAIATIEEAKTYIGI